MNAPPNADQIWTAVGVAAYIFVCYQVLAGIISEYHWSRIIVDFISNDLGPSFQFLANGGFTAPRNSKKISWKKTGSDCWNGFTPGMNNWMYMIERETSCGIHSGHFYAMVREDANSCMWSRCVDPDPGWRYSKRAAMKDAHEHAKKFMRLVPPA